MAKAGKTTPRLVLVEWVDSHQNQRWTSEPPATEPVVCRSVGWLTHDGKTAKTLSANMTIEEQPQRTGDMTIPTCAIVRMRDLR